MSGAFDEIMTVVNEIGQVDDILGQFLTYLPWWVSASLGVSVVFGVFCFVYKLIVG